MPIWIFKTAHSPAGVTRLLVFPLWIVYWVLQIRSGFVLSVSLEDLNERGGMSLVQDQFVVGVTLVAQTISADLLGPT